MNTTEEHCSTQNKPTVANSLDIDDPDLIEFMNTKMNLKSETLVDIVFDIASFSFENIIINPYNYICDYISQFFSNEFIDQFRTTLFLNGVVMDKSSVTTSATKMPIIHEEELELESDHVMVENNSKP